MSELNKRDEKTEAIQTKGQKMIYEPERFIIMKLEKEYKVLGGWSGGYLGADIWRLNSGVSRFERESGVKN